MFTGGWKNLLRVLEIRLKNKVAALNMKLTLLKTMFKVRDDYSFSCDVG